MICGDACQLGLARCHGRNVPRFCELVAMGREDYVRYLRDLDATETGVPVGWGEAGPEPGIDPTLDIIREFGQAAEQCPCRHEVEEAGCCGPVTKCVDGRRPGQHVDIAICSQCFSEHGPIS